MCIVFVQNNVSSVGSKYKLIIAANRDEYYARPTKPANFLENNPSVLCGLDLEPGVEGGTWFGVNRQGKFGFLTNYLLPTTDEELAKSSRGFVVRNFLESDIQPEQYIEENLMNRAHRSHHFVGGQFTNGCKDLNISYFGSKDPKSPIKLDMNTFTLGCSVLGTKWHKVTHGENKFRQEIQNTQANPKELMQKLLDNLLSDTTCLYPDELVTAQSGSRMSEEFLKCYCSVMISGDRYYGTRMQTVVVVDQENTLYFMERTVDPLGNHPLQYFSFPIEI